MIDMISFQEIKESRQIWMEIPIIEIKGWIKIDKTSLDTL